MLVDGDDHNEPIADAARSILDGHVVLDRKLAVAGHFPTVDVLGSISRVATTRHHARRSATPRPRCAASWPPAGRRRTCIDVGAYAPGTNPLVDAAVDARRRDRRVPAAGHGRAGGRRAVVGAPRRASSHALGDLS